MCFFAALASGFPFKKNYLFCILQKPVYFMNTHHVNWIGFDYAKSLVISMNRQCSLHWFAKLKTCVYNVPNINLFVYHFFISIPSQCQLWRVFLYCALTGQEFWSCLSIWREAPKGIQKHFSEAYGCSLFRPPLCFDGVGALLVLVGHVHS